MAVLPISDTFQASCPNVLQCVTGSPGRAWQQIFGNGPIDDDVAVKAARLAGSEGTVQIPDTENIIPAANRIICGINH